MPLNIKKTTVINKRERERGENCLWDLKVNKKLHEVLEKIGQNDGMTIEQTSMVRGPYKIDWTLSVYEDELMDVEPCMMVLLSNIR